MRAIILYEFCTRCESILYTPVSPSMRIVEAWIEYRAEKRSCHLIRVLFIAFVPSASEKGYCDLFRTKLAQEQSFCVHALQLALPSSSHHVTPQLCQQEENWVFYSCYMTDSWKSADLNVPKQMLTHCIFELYLNCRLNFYDAIPGTLHRLFTAGRDGLWTQMIRLACNFGKTLRIAWNHADGGVAISDREVFTLQLVKDGRRIVFFKIYLNITTWMAQVLEILPSKARLRFSSPSPTVTVSLELLSFCCWTFKWAAAQIHLLQRTCASEVRKQWTTCYRCLDKWMTAR